MSDHPRTNIWPVMRYRDAPAAIHFLVTAFGFEEAMVVPGQQEGTVVHAELRWPAGGGVMVGSVRDEDDPSRVLASGSGAVYVVTEDPDALYRRATSAGATVVRELADEDYGSRDFTVRDPEGLVWSFGTYAGG